MAKVTKEYNEKGPAVSYKCKCGKEILLLHNDKDEDIKILSFCWNCLFKIDNIF